LIELARALEAWGLALDRSHLEAFEIYYRELVAWNRKFNLTGITSRDEVARFHFMDSLSLYLYAESLDLPRATRLVDVGSGAGFPGIPVKIVCPHLHVTLVESASKKAAFLRHLVGVLGIVDVEIVQARAEDVAQWPRYRESYDLAVARAVAPMAVLAELLLPLARVGGRAVAFKTENALEEIRDAIAAIRICGGGPFRIQTYSIPGADKPRILVTIGKVGPTPPQYPRKPGIPFKRPLA
jgi:16S rRNA (guanine527-N7)-methyltransferase